MGVITNMDAVGRLTDVLSEFLHPETSARMAHEIVDSYRTYGHTVVTIPVTDSKISGSKDGEYGVILVRLV